MARIVAAICEALAILEIISGDHGEDGVGEAKLLAAAGDGFRLLGVGGGGSVIVANVAKRTSGCRRDPRRRNDACVIVVALEIGSGRAPLRRRCARRRRRGPVSYHFRYEEACEAMEEGWSSRFWGV